jgi:hypothetical protein
MFEDSDGDLLYHYADYLESGAHLAVMPVARLSFDWSPLAFPAGITVYSDVQTDKLRIVPNDLKSHSLAEHASAVSGIDEAVLFQQPVVVFPVRFDWHRFRRNSHKANMEFIRKLSDHVDRTCFNFIRYRQCPIFTNGDWIHNLPGRAGQINSNHMVSGALLYNHSLREARIIGGDAFTHIITRGLGLPLEGIDQSEFPQEGEVGFIVNHALSLYTAMLEASNPTAFFIQALALLEFLAYPDEYRKFEDVKKVIARYVAKNPTEYNALLDRLFVLTGKKEADTGRIIGYRTRIVHMGERIEDIEPDEEQRKRLFFELDGYIRSVIDHMIKHSEMSFGYYLTIRESLRPYEA